MKPLARLLIFACCGATGYFTASALIPSGRSPVPERKSASPPIAGGHAPAPSNFKEGELMAEWEQFRAQHSAGGTDLGAAYAATKDVADAFRRRAFRSAVIAEWASTNPAAALAYLLEKDRGQAAQLMREWLRIDPEAAIDGVLAAGEKARGQLRTLARDIARLAPSRLAEVVSAMPKSSNRWDTTAQDAFAIYAEKDPEAARAAAESVKGAMRSQALAGIARAWGETDGPAALAWAEKLSPGEERDMALKAGLIGWAKRDPVGALGRIDAVPPGGDEMYHASDAGAQVLREAAKHDWDATMKWLQDNPGKLGRTSLDGLQSALSQMLMSDVRGTLNSIASGNVPGLAMVLGNSLLNDGYPQHAAVWKWLDEHPSNSFTQGLRSSVLNAIAWKEPDRALGFLEQLPDTPENRELFARGTGSLLNGGQEMQRFEGLLASASPKLRPYLMEAGFNYGLHNPAADPATWVSRLTEIPEERRADATMSLARNWASKDPEAAVAWSRSLSDPQLRDVAFRSVTSGWANSDPYEAASWVESLPAGPDRDKAATGLAYALSRNQPETAWSWALSVESPSDRMNAIGAVYRGLMQKDPAIAKQMLESANLPADQVEALTKMNSLRR